MKPVTDREVRESKLRCVTGESFVDRNQRFAFEIESLRARLADTEKERDGAVARVEVGVWLEAEEMSKNKPGYQIGQLHDSSYCGCGEALAEDFKNKSQSAKGTEG